MHNYLRCASNERFSSPYLVEGRSQPNQNQPPPKRERLKNTKTKDVPFPLICYLRDSPVTNRKRLRNPKVDN